MNEKFDELAKSMAQSATRRGPLKKFFLGLAGIALVSPTRLRGALLCLAVAAHFTWPTRAPAGPASLAAPFTRVTNSPVATEYAYSWGCAWADYDNDGFIDLFVENSYESYNSLFRNNGDGTFKKITDPAVGAIVSDVGNFHGCAWGDVENDGFLDLLVTQNPGKNHLYRNNGDGTFSETKSSGSSGLLTQTGEKHGVAWGDYDNDGFLDVVVGQHGPNKHNRLYHNNGDGTFDEVSTSNITQDTGDSEGIAWGDYDNDGYLDLFVANFSGHNYLYHNHRDGTFTRMLDSVVEQDEANSVGCAWGDYNNDGFLDLFVANLDGRPNFFFRNNRDGSFTKITAGALVSDGYGFGCAWADYDNDGWLDLFVNRGISGGAGKDNALYHNNGDGSFTPVTGGRLVHDGGQGKGCAWGDYDNDGFQDLFAANGGFVIPLHQQLHFLYHNDGNSNNWITVKLVGTASNRPAIGAKVRVLARTGGNLLWQMREVSGGGNYGSQNDVRASFGLGKTQRVDTLRIEWPSGTVQEFHEVAVKQFLTITEP